VFSIIMIRPSVETTGKCKDIYKYMMDYKNTIVTILSTMVQIKLVVCTKRNKVWVIWYQGDVESGLRSWFRPRL